MYKKGDKDNVQNYRSISVTPAICLLVERIAAHQMKSYWEDTGILYDDQYGFRTGRSPGQLINRLWIYFYEDPNKVAAIVLNDFSTAFVSPEPAFIIYHLSKHMHSDALKLVYVF